MDLESIDLQTFHAELDLAVELYESGRTDDAIKALELYIQKLGEVVAAGERLKVVFPGSGADSLVASPPDIAQPKATDCQ